MLRRRVLNVIYSNRFEALVDALADDLAAVRESGALDLYTPATVIVPGGMVAAAVRLGVARRSGIAAHIRFPFLEGFLAGLVERARPGWRVLDRRLLQTLLLSLLSDPARLEGDELAPVRDYIGGAGPAGEVRRAQLAGELAGLFLEYTLSRPEMIAAWTREPAGVASSATEAWQRALWRGLFAAGGLAGASAGPGGRLAPLAALFAEVSPAELAEAVRGERVGPPPPVYVIGFSYLARGYRPMLAQLGRALPLRLYSLNPCREFWDDVEGRARSADDTPALALWGRPGREHVAALNDMTEGDFADHFAEPAGESALARLQRDILARAPRRTAADRAGASGDRSIEVLACPGVRRELEVIGNHIAALLAADRSLRLCDVAILLAPDGCEHYQAQIGAVFGEIGLRHRAVDLPLQGESRVVEAVHLLLDLPLGRFTRPELLGLMVHPAVLARHPDVDRDDWIRWCDELGIVHGADQRDHRGTYIEGDVYNWDQGLRRLALGSFMDGGAGGEPPAVRLGAHTYLPARVAPDERRSAARFALLARSLIGEARACRDAARPLADWAEHIDRWVARHIGAAGPADERALARCREAIRQLAALDVDGRAVAYPAVRELLRDAFGALRTGGELPTDAILVAPLSPMRPLPVRVLYLAGLGAGRFPAGDQAGAFDLRAGARRAGDVSPRDRDRYTFLEALLSARERLVLSYVARDEETGEELEPSSLIHELVDVLAEGYLAPEDAAALPRRFPLRRWEDPEARDPVSRRQAQCAALRRDLLAHAAARGAPVPDEEALRRELARPERADLARFLGLGAVTAAAAAAGAGAAAGAAAATGTAAGAKAAAAIGSAPDASFASVSASESSLDWALAKRAPITLPLSAIRRFLECPLQGWASAALGLRAASDEDALTRRDEPFEQTLLALTAALRGVFIAHLAEGGDASALARLHRAASQREQAAGRAPTGPFAEGAERRGARILGRWRAALLSLAGALPRPELIGFGGVREEEPITRLEPAIEIEAGGALVRLVGRLEPLGDAEIGSIILVTGDDWSDRHVLRGAVDMLALSAAGLAAPGGHRAVLLTGAGRATRFAFPPLEPTDARAHLAALVEDLLTGPHDYLLPCEAALGLTRKPRARRPASLAAAVRKLQSGESFFSSKAGPLRLPRHIAPPPDAEALRDRRYGLWLDRLERIDG